MPNPSCLHAGKASYKDTYLAPFARVAPFMPEAGVPNFAVAPPPGGWVRPPDPSGVSGSELHALAGFLLRIYRVTALQPAGRFLPARVPTAVDRTEASTVAHSALGHYVHATVCRAHMRRLQLNVFADGEDPEQADPGG